MKTLLSLVLVLFTLTASVQAQKADACTVQEGSTEKADLFTAMEEGKSPCGCATVQNGETKQVQSYTLKNGEMAPVKYCIELQEPIAGIEAVSGKNGVDLLSSYIQQIYIYGASIIGIICVLVIVVSGVQISMGGANSEFVNQGKERILQALLSLILLFSSGLILRTVNPGFFVSGNEPGPDFAYNQCPADATVEEGDFDPNTGKLIEGKIKESDGSMKEGIFDPQTGRLLEGTETSPDGFITKGKFDDDVGLTDKNGYEKDTTGVERKGEFKEGDFISGTVVYPDGTTARYDDEKCVENCAAEKTAKSQLPAVQASSDGNVIVVTANTKTCRFNRNGERIQ